MKAVSCLKINVCELAKERRKGIKKAVPAQGLSLRHSRGGGVEAGSGGKSRRRNFLVSRPPSVGSAEQAPARRFRDEGEARRRRGPKRERSGPF